MNIPPPDELLHRIRALPAAAPLLERLDDADAVHLVGGAVRDLLLETSPSELDLVVEGDAAELAAKLGGRLRSHDRFGTATVALNGHLYDIARSRRETYAHPGALPEVEPAPLTEDLERRDFTINATAIALSGPGKGTLTAVPKALDDLEQKRLRVLHDRSFIDDPTRLLRMVRYASRLGFTPEPRTAALAQSARDQGALKTVSGPRVGSELRLLAREPDPVRAFQALDERGIAGAIDPALGGIDAALARRALELLPDDGRRDLLTIAVALRGQSPSALLDELAFEAGDRDTILAAATGADLLAQALTEATAPSEIARAARGKPPELVALAGALGPARKATEWLTRLRRVELEIDGRDLIAAGVPEGPQVGAGLDAALRAKLDGRAGDRAAELAEALAAAR